LGEVLERVALAPADGALADAEEAKRWSLHRAPNTPDAPPARPIA
jgi:hypothetical protein